MFHLGDKAFYPAHGVGVIENIEKSIGNGDDVFYVLKIMDTGLTLKVSKQRVSEAGLRHLTSADKIKDVYSALKKKSDLKCSKNFTPWNRRQRDYIAKIKSGSALEHAEILKELTILQSQKPLSFGEKKLLEQVKRLLVKELACCQDCAEDTICSQIESMLNS